MFAYCCVQSVDDFPTDFLDLVDCEQPLQSKTILNSRVLGYGQLNGHVASIVSIFSKSESFEKEMCW